MRLRRLCHRLEHPFLLRLIEGQHVNILSPQAREIGFRKAHDLRALGRRFGQKPLDLVQAVIKG